MAHPRRLGAAHPRLRDTHPHPGVCLIRLDAPREPVRVTPPLLCIEILSPEDRPTRVSKRLDEFLAMGVQSIGIIDPPKRIAYTYTHEGCRAVPGPILRVTGTPIFLDLPTLFAALD